MGIFNYKEKKKNTSNNLISSTNSYNNLKETNNQYNKFNDVEYTSKLANQLSKNQTIDITTSQSNMNKFDKINININSTSSYNNMEDEF